MASDPGSCTPEVATEVSDLVREHVEALARDWLERYRELHPPTEADGVTLDPEHRAGELRRVLLEPYLADLGDATTHATAAAVREQCRHGFLRHLGQEQFLDGHRTLRDLTVTLVSGHFASRRACLPQALHYALRPFDEAEHAFLALYRESLDLSEKRRQDFFEDAIHAAFIADLDGSLTDVNTEYERLFGVSRAECLGHPLVDEMVARGLSRPRAELIWEMLQAEGRVDRMRCTAVDSHGRNVYVELSSSYTLDPDLTRSGLYGMLADITDRREAELRLEETNAALAEVNERIREQYHQLQNLERTKEDLTAMIVHDMRNPVSVVLASLDTLKASSPPAYEDPATRELLQMAERSGRHLMNMINDLLDISRLESGAMELKLEPVPPAELQEAALERVRLLIERDDLTLQHAAEAGLAPVQADREAIIRVLVNLLTNALKFTPAGGEVRTVVTRASGEPAVVFSVADTGPGVPPEFQDRIFQKFVQVEARRQGTKPSTGLGLTYCKMAVEAHGGRIWLQSEPGHGAEFFFTLPNRAHD